MGKLVLSRKIGESVRVGDNGIITITNIYSNEIGVFRVDYGDGKSSMLVHIPISESFLMTAPDNELIEIFLKSISGGQVKIAIEAPEHINILREELYHSNIDGNQEGKS